MLPSSPTRWLASLGLQTLLQLYPRARPSPLLFPQSTPISRTLKAVRSTVRVDVTSPVVASSNSSFFAQETRLSLDPVKSSRLKLHINTLSPLPNQIFYRKLLLTTPFT